MKVIIDNTTGHFIEGSSCSTDETLITNAEAAGFFDTRIEQVTDAEFQAMIMAKNAVLV